LAVVSVTCAFSIGLISLKHDVEAAMKALVALLAIPLALVSAAAAAEGKVKRALLIGLDGARPDALAKANTPNIDALIADGAFTSQADILGKRYQKNDTISGPGWGSILTGVWADKHGVDGNEKFEKFRDFPTLFTHIKKARPDALTAAIVTWEPLANHLTRDAATIERIEIKNDDYDAGDGAVAQAAAKLLAEKDPLATFVYFGQIDVAGHKKGFHPTVPEYVAAIERVDALVGQVIAAVKQRAAFAQEDWLIVMTTDHGGKGTNHGQGHHVPEIRTVFLLVSGDSAARGEIKEPAYIVDAPATVLAHLGINADHSSSLDGRAAGLKKSASPSNAR
jgi:predicted AlkP superfamily pyrophosphatase or phosphodiesterase